MASGGELSYDAERFTKATLKESPTLLYNNLTADQHTMGYVHMNQALMIPIASALSGDNVEKFPILSPEGIVAAYQVRLVTLGAESFFVLATANGVQIYDGKGKQLMHSHALPEGKTVLTGSGAEMANHARGICSSCTADGHAQVCVGSAAGSVFVIEYDGSRFRTSTTLQEGQHGASITDLGSEVDSYRGSAPAGAETPRPILVSADDAGLVNVWAANTSTDFAKLFETQLKSPVAAVGDTSNGASSILPLDLPSLLFQRVAARREHVIAAEVSGVVSFISLITQRVYCELQAHSRFLSAMDIHPWRDVFATVAEDSTVGVWTLPREGSGGGGGESGAAAEPGAGAAEVQCVFATCWRDSMLTGVTFCGDRGDSLAVCAHDELELCVWQ